MSFTTPAPRPADSRRSSKPPRKSQPIGDSPHPNNLPTSNTHQPSGVQRRSKTNTHPATHHMQSRPTLRREQVEHRRSRVVEQDPINPRRVLIIKAADRRTTKPPGVEPSPHHSLGPRIDGTGRHGPRIDPRRLDRMRPPGLLLGPPPR